MVFYAVNGGAFGIEDIVAAGGPYFALVGECVNVCVVE
jgi:hypothetical protein